MAGFVGDDRGGVWGSRVGWGGRVFPMAIIHGVFETSSGFRFFYGMVRCGLFSSFLRS